MTLCVTAIARSESAYLLEWTAYQRIVGADQIMIYDNGHDAKGRFLLERLHKRGVINLVPWHGRYPHGPQIPAYNHALSLLQGQVDWVLFVDLDEFVVPVADDQISALLNRSDDLDGIWFPWLIFGSSGQRQYQPMPVIERFRRRQSVDNATVTPVKSAVRPLRAICADLHVHQIDTPAYANPLGERDYIPNRSGERYAAQVARGFHIARVHHYMTKSEQEWCAKVARGRADRGSADSDTGRDVSEFAQWDRNEVEDLTALRFLPDLQAELRLLRKLIDGE